MCGGHAGDATSAQFWADAACNAGCQVHLHPSLPDRAYFGRIWQDIPWPTLRDSLREQRRVLPTCASIKLHGALYNRAMIDTELASRIVSWAHHDHIATIIAMPGSALAAAATSAGLTVIHEGFLDRGYIFRDNRLQLQPRAEPGALINDPARCQARLEQYAADSSITDASGRAPLLRH